MEGIMKGGDTPQEKEWFLIIFGIEDDRGGR
jgi:hypothetical protein